MPVPATPALGLGTTGGWGSRCHSAPSGVNAKRKEGVGGRPSFSLGSLSFRQLGGIP